MSATSEKHVYHVALLPDLEQARSSGSYSTASLAAEGFIHCCSAEQLSGVLQRYFTDVENYEVVKVVLDRLQPTLQPVYENTVGGTELFPHIYGAIPMAALERDAGSD